MKNPRIYTHWLVTIKDGDFVFQLPVHFDTRSSYEGAVGYAKRVFLHGIELSADADISNAKITQEQFETLAKVYNGYAWIVSPAKPGNPPVSPEDTPVQSMQSFIPEYDPDHITILIEEHRDMYTFPYTVRKLNAWGWSDGTLWKHDPYMHHADWDLVHEIDNVRFYRQR